MIDKTKLIVAQKALDDLLEKQRAKRAELEETVKKIMEIESKISIYEASGQGTEELKRMKRRLNQVKAERATELSTMKSEVRQSTIECDRIEEPFRKAAFRNFFKFIKGHFEESETLDRTKFWAYFEMAEFPRRENQ